MLTKQVADRTYNYSYCIGRSSNVGHGFTFPVDFALGSGESLYVVSRGHLVNSTNGITKCTLDQDFIWENRGEGFCDGQSPWPSSVDLDSNENVYVSDDYTNRIHIFDNDGNQLGSWGTAGSRDGELNGPFGLSFDREDNLYIVDGLNHRVQKFTKDGRFLAKWGSQGSKEGQFNTPWGIALDKEGNVYVADWKNDRVQKLSPDGEYLASFGQPGTSDGELYRPTGVVVDKEGDVYVTDWGNDRLNIYTPDGTFLTNLIGNYPLIAWVTRFTSTLETVYDKNMSGSKKKNPLLPSYEEGELRDKSIEKKQRAGYQPKDLLRIIRRATEKAPDGA